MKFNEEMLQAFNLEPVVKKNLSMLCKSEKCWIL